MSIQANRKSSIQNPSFVIYKEIDEPKGGKIVIGLVGFVSSLKVVKRKPMERLLMFPHMLLHSCSPGYWII